MSADGAAEIEAGAAEAGAAAAEFWVFAEIKARIVAALKMIFWRRALGLDIERIGRMIIG